MLKKNPINENLKNTDPLKWTGLNKVRICIFGIIT